MIVVNATIEALPGKEKEVEQTLRALIPQVQKEERTLIYDLHRSTNNPACFFFYECYPDMEAFEAHSAQPYLQELGGKLEGLLKKEPFVDSFELIDRIQK